jgi:hypothetical protein
LQALLAHLFGRLEAHYYEVGEYIVHEGDCLLRQILTLHSAEFNFDAIASDYELLQNLFTRDIIELNKFEPCAEARKPRPHLKLDPIYEKLVLKKSGDRHMDDLADLAIMLDSYEAAVSLTNRLTQTQVDYFIFRYNERSRDPAQLITEQNHEFFFNEWMRDQWNKDYLANAFFGGR